MPPFYLTTPIYYVNDAPHVGTAYTTVNADALARWHRLLGDDVLFLTGHRRARRQDRGGGRGERHDAPGVDRPDLGQRFVEAWRRLDIANDDFIRTTEPRHYEAVQQFLQRDLRQRLHRARAPTRASTASRCEDYYTEDQLVDGKCPVHGRAVIEMEEENYFFKLSQFEDRLLDYYDSHPDSVRPDLQAQRGPRLHPGRPARHLDHPHLALRGACRCPGTSGHVFYVWYDALINYLTAIGYGGDQAVFEPRGGRPSTT